MNLKSYFEQFQKALNDEIKTLRNKGGQKTYLSQGHYLSIRDKKYLYSFVADNEVRFPDETPIDLEYKKIKYTGILISVDSFDLIIALDKKLDVPNNEQINFAILYTEPWFIFEELKKRLYEILNSKQLNQEMILKLLSDNSNNLKDYTGSASNLLSKIEQALTKPIIRNKNQEQAINLVLENKISFIWGPPGTGKTTTLGMTVASLIYAGESVLIVAHSNTAVDTAMKSIAKYVKESPLYKEGLIFRFGIQTTGILDDFPLLDTRKVVKKQNHLLVEKITQLELERRKILKIINDKSIKIDKTILTNKLSKINEELKIEKLNLKNLELPLIKKAQVIGCTISKASIAKEIYERKFDAVIVDEASMAYVPHCTFVTALAKRRVAFFGDFKQLSPISQGNTENTKNWLEIDIFEQAGITAKVSRGQQDSRMVLLNTQYRMSPDISMVPNVLFYHKQLNNGENVLEDNSFITKSVPHPGKSLIFYDINQLSAFCCKEIESHSRFNLISALISISVAYEIWEENSKISIGIITPYNAQARLIHNLLQDIHLSEQIKVATVHRFQGSEKNIIIFDSVDGFPQANPGKLIMGDKNSTAMRLVNVAVSRAQGKFIGLFNLSYIKQKINTFNIFRVFTDYLYNVSEKNSLIWDNFFLKIPNVKYFSNIKDAKTFIKEDLLGVTDNLVIKYDGFFLWLKELSKCNQKNISFYISGENREKIAENLKNTHVFDIKQIKNRTQTNMGFIGIDRKKLWIFIDSLNREKPVICIENPKTIDIIYAFFQLIPDKGSSIIKDYNFPLGKCNECNQPLWPSENQYGYYQVTCTKHPYHHQRQLSADDVTKMATFMKKKCPECHSQIKGVKGINGVFISCTKCHKKIGLNYLF